MRAILTYHSIDESGSPISVNDETWARHVAWLRSGAVRVMRLDDIAEAPDGSPAVALTFDDGFQNFQASVWPRLRDHGLPVTLFVVSGHVGRDNRWGGRAFPGIPIQPLLDWDGLGALAEEGVQVGAHSRTHPDLRRLGAAALEDEVAGSLDDLACRLGQGPRPFCYPFGAHDAAVVRTVARCATLACTVMLSPLSGHHDRFRLPRLDAFYLRAPGVIEGFGSPSFARRMAVRRWGRALRGALRL